jgi:hypothetical protein
MSSSGLDGGVKMCNFNKTLLHEYIDGELAPLEVQILEEHLKSCSECRKELNQLKILDWDLHHQDAIEVPYEQLAQLRKSTFDDCCREYWESQESQISFTDPQSRLMRPIMEDLMFVTMCRRQWMRGTT